MRRSVSFFVLVAMLGAVSAVSVGLAAPASADAGHVFTIDPTTTVGEAAGNASVTIHVAPAPQTGEVVSVDWATSDSPPSTATSGTDYTFSSGTATFAATQTTQTVMVPITSDTIHETNETFKVNLINPQTVTCAVTCTVSSVSLGSPSTDTVTITDDDLQPVFTINDVTVTEGDAGTIAASFTVTRSTGTVETTTVDFTTADGTAKVADGDYQLTSGTLTFPPSGALATQPISVNVAGDTLDEPSETFVVNLSNATNATISDNQGLGTINDDDAAGVSLSINDVAVTEGNAGTVNAVFTVTKTQPTGQTVTVAYTTADGTAVAPGDYTTTSSPPSPPLSFAPNETMKTITVPVNGDTTDEADETFLVNLSSPTNATISDAQGQGTITNDDKPQASVSDASATEGGNETFTVTLSAPPGLHQNAIVNFDTEPVSGTATEGTDYPHTTGSVTFGPTETSRTITVATTQDTLDEPDETFVVHITKPAVCCPGDGTPGPLFDYAISDGTGQGTILDNDAAVTTLSIDDVTVTEGNAGTTNAVFTVTKTGATGQTVTVDYTTADDTATAPSDYVLATGPLTFLPADTTKTITVATNGDTIDEPNETYFVNLTNATNASISDAQGLGTISDNDAPVSFAIDDVTSTEGNTGSAPATFTVTKTGSTAFTTKVDFTTANNTATQPGDYATNSGTLTFAPGDTTKPIAVSIVGDTAHEPNETYFVNLTNPISATISDAQGLGTINDNDAAPNLGDFNGDGFSDSAFGVPNDQVGSVTKAGAVNVIYGSATGLATATPTADQLWTLDTTGVTGTAATGDKFGSALAVGNFNDDNFSDLAIGIPGKSAKAGAVTVLYGSASGLTSSGNQLLAQGSGGIVDTAEAGDAFGAALAAGDLNGDGSDDLAVGVPNESVGSLATAGAVNVIYGSLGGLTSSGNQLWHLDVAGVPGNAKAGDLLGRAVGTGDINGDGKDDLAVGIPGRDVSGSNAGAAVVLYGSSSGLSSTNSQGWNQNSSGIVDAAEADDVFGSSVAAGDFNSDGFSDVVFGVPGEAVGTVLKAGGAHVLFGSATGLSSTNNKLWTQDSTGIFGVSEAGDAFGVAVSTGDVNGDGNADLVVGVSGEDIGTQTDTGGGHVLLGSASGLTATGSQFWSEDSTGIAGTAETGDTFGASLVTGFFNGDNKADVIFGVPGEAIGSIAKAGLADVLYGSASGLTASGSQFWDQDVPNVEGSAVAGDAFARAVG